MLQGNFMMHNKIMLLVKGNSYNKALKLRTLRQNPYG